MKRAKSILSILTISLVCAQCTTPRYRDAQKHLDSNEWKILTSSTAKDVFYKDTLQLSLCKHCYTSPLAFLPAMYFNRFSREKNGSYNFMNPQKNEFLFCSTISVDSVSAHYKSDFFGKWKLKEKGDELKLILYDIENCSEDLASFFPPKSQKKGKVTYSVILLNSNQMTLVKKK